MNFLAKATNSIAKATNSFANGTNSFAKGTKSIAKKKNSIVKTCKTAFIDISPKQGAFLVYIKIMIFSQLTVFLLRFFATAEKRTEILTYIKYVHAVNIICNTPSYDT